MHSQRDAGNEIIFPCFLCIQWFILHNTSFLAPSLWLGVKTGGSAARDFHHNSLNGGGASGNAFPAGRWEPDKDFLLGRSFNPREIQQVAL